MAKRRIAETKSPAVTKGMVRKLSENLRDRAVPPTVAEELVETLNGGNLDTEGRSRVLRVIQLLQTRHWYTARLLRGDLKDWDSRHSVALLEVLIEDAFTLNELLLRYRLSPQIGPLRKITTLSFLPFDEDTSVAESSAVMRALQLAERDDFDRVRECTCGKFFLAGRIDQQHCSTACRVKAHQSSDEFKAKRREADRERYRLHRDGKLKETNRRKSNGTQKAR
jgi:hypothetical protein